MLISFDKSLIFIIGYRLAKIGATIHEIITEPIVEIIKPITAELYYGAETEIKKFDLKYRADELSAWENVKILKTDDLP